MTVHHHRNPMTISKGVTVYPPAYIHKTAKIGNGTQISGFCDIGKDVEIGENCSIQSHVTISNGCKIGNNVFIGPNTSLLNVRIPVGDYKHSPKIPVIVRDGAIIGGGCTILPGVVINEEAVVGAGAVITKDVPKRTIVYCEFTRVVKRR